MPTPYYSDFHRGEADRALEQHEANGKGVDSPGLVEGAPRMENPFVASLDELTTEQMSSLDPSLVTEDNFSKDQLIAIAEARGLDSSGNKADIVKRIQGGS